MKKRYVFGIICTTLLLLASCAQRLDQNRSALLNSNLVFENWMQQINTDPSIWTRQGDRWFFTGEPSQFNQFGSFAPDSKTYSAMMVRATNFTNIDINGPFTVQMFGQQDHNSIFVIGPNESTRQTAVETRGNTLYIHVAPDCQNSHMDKVVIRIGLRTLHNLNVTGCAKVEATHLQSACLNIKAMGNPNILLAGHMNLGNVTQIGNGYTSVIGAYTPSLNIHNTGYGTVSVSGRVGIQNIVNSVAGKVNIIGADSNSLDIDSSGCGVVRVAGFVNLKKIIATQSSKVYVYWVNSNGIYVTLHDSARVGLAGVTCNLNVEADGTTRFEGKYLRSDNTYVRTRESSHANVSPVKKLFANSLDNSSIYFFSSPNAMSRYTLGRGIVVPVWNDAAPAPRVPPSSSWSWGSRK
ncbi:MAG: DUF2807 domain-containing protein [Gammaproteobacteria bacterium]|nr:DUF2807 domain-containing protein [Gammaproteobacteria bacterium]